MGQPPVQAGCVGIGQDDNGFAAARLRFVAQHQPGEPLRPVPFDTPSTRTS